MPRFCQGFIKTIQRLYKGYMKIEPRHNNKKIIRYPLRNRQGNIKIYINIFYYKNTEKNHYFLDLGFISFNAYSQH